MYQKTESRTEMFGTFLVFLCKKWYSFLYMNLQKKRNRVKKELKNIKYKTSNIDEFNYDDTESTSKSDNHSSALQKDCVKKIKKEIIKIVNVFVIEGIF